MFNFSLRGLKSLPITKFLQHSSCQMYVLRSLSCRKMREINKFTMLLLFHGHSMPGARIFCFANLLAVGIFERAGANLVYALGRHFLFYHSYLRLWFFNCSWNRFFNSLWSSSIVCIFSVRIRFTIYYLSEFTHMKMTNKFKDKLKSNKTFLF